MNAVDAEFDTPATYRIRIAGYLDNSWSDRLGGVTITTKTKAGETPVTTLSGELVDEAALAGVLNALYDLGYSLQSVKKIKPKEEHVVEKRA